jgi:hypothetical protein
MERRDLLKQIALLTGGLVMGGELFLSGCKSGAKMDAGFTEDSIALLNEIGETIIPATTTPGAKAAQVGEFMKTFVTDCYTKEEQTTFLNGIVQLEEACKKLHGSSFMDCDAKQRKDLLLSLEKEAKTFNEPITIQKENKTPLHYYTMIKQLTLFGFFTSKTGATETLRHVAVPGKFDGAFPYKKGDKAWAED